MNQLPTRNPIYRWFLRVDSLVGSTLFELGDLVRRRAMAYAVFLDRFRIRGIRRLVVDALDDSATFAMIVGLGLLMYALPPFSGTGDIWNLGRQYAVTFTDISGEIIGRRGIRQDDAIPLEEIPPYVINAVLATEDARFYQHFGLDVFGTFRALIENARANDVRQGGSSITQQLAKNLFLTPEKTLRRKINEAFLAMWIEARLSKDEILKMYLDRSYLGGGTYGVEAAAQFYFGKSVRDVNLSEAAMLAGLFKAPSKYAPHANVAEALTRANTVLHRMLDEEFISHGELLAAKRDAPRVISQSLYYSPDYFLDFAYAETLALIESQGLQSDYVIEVKSTAELRLQQAAQRIVNEAIDNEAPAYRASQAALVSTELDGAIKALVGGRNYEDSQFNRATDALRQPGSSFKPFVYLAALLGGYTPESRVNDTPVSIGNWSPRNYTGKYVGRTTLTKALTHSYNSIPVHLMKELGRQSILDAARQSGLQATLLPVPSLPLGTNEVTLVDMTSAYVTFANGGKPVKPYTVLEIRRPNGDLLYSRASIPAPPKQSVPPEKIAELNVMMSNVVKEGTGRGAMLGFTPQAGKTGTNQSYRDAWFIGYTGHYVTGVWFGNDDFSEMKRMTGGTLPAATWKKYMLEALANKPPADLPGVPVDETYTRYVAEGEGTGELPGTGGQARARSKVASRDTDFGESGDDNVNVYRPPEASDGVVSVLQDMFSIFGKKKQPASAVGARKKKRKSGNFNFFQRKN
ncbi:MAG: PBP1A family penicillin-binding protein [Pseudomonadota bacterium]|nr:PBP1A family penicillin-binding protein [Pseudomonadota bacterium]